MLIVGFKADPLLYELVEVQTYANSESESCCADSEKCCCDKDCCDSETQQCNGDCQDTPYTSTVFAAAKITRSITYPVTFNMLTVSISNYFFILPPIIWHPPQVA
jgi:Tfp pilus assembly protein PilX